MVDSKSYRSNSMSFKAEDSQNDEAAINKAAIRAIISILTGSIRRVNKDQRFRETLQATCYSGMVKRKKELDYGMLANMRQGIKRVAENHEISRELENKGAELFLNSDFTDRDKDESALSKVYNDQMTFRDENMKVDKFLNGLKNEEGSLNTKHLLLLYLRQVPLEKRPLVAAILQLDLMVFFAREILYSVVFIEKKHWKPLQHL
ncbi:hypothetical protein NE237_000804 [Protea cynaroides]|uniref:Uncharacterized protein n=1 Tax=Protea cynaroides TaxID=273540 RepID=A0A9Q0KRY3_9MAGN|nr:hypothetical protein NE237_000804 [Protea cynaroides]